MRHIVKPRRSWRVGAYAANRTRSNRINLTVRALDSNGEFTIGEIEVDCRQPRGTSVHATDHRQEWTQLVRPGNSECIHSRNDRIVMSHCARAEIKHAVIFLRDDPTTRAFTERIRQ